MVTYNPSMWDLSEVAPKNINEVYKDIETKTTKIERKRDSLNNISPKDFMELIQELENLSRICNKLSSFANLRFSEDSSNQESVALMSKIEQFLANITNRLLFLDIWFKELSDKKAQEFIDASNQYSYYFEKKRLLKPYTLEENEEKIINIKDVSGVYALSNIYTILTSQFKYKFQGKDITQEELFTFVRDKSPKVRKAAYKTIFSPFIAHKDVIGEIYKNIVNDWREEYVTLRGYKTPIQARNVGNDIPDKAVESLLKVCEKNQALFQDFFELKKEILGLKKMTRFDLYAPIEEKQEKILYNDAVKLVLSTFEQFSPKFKDNALKILNSNHVHSIIQKNKQSGAYCCSINAKMVPFVFLNYTGTLRDVSTMAHELGHGIHHMLAAHHTEFTFHASSPLAETASIFSEMILSDKIMESDSKKAQELLFLKMGDLYASIPRQAGFVEFEKKAHSMMKDGKTIQEMSDAYIADLKKQMGPNIEIDDIFAYEWAHIPHIFHIPFYCYSYAFGNLLTLSLYEMYKEKGSMFTPKIIEMLSKGGSQSPVDITTSVGIDICSEDFWQRGFDVIKDMLKKIE